MLSASIEPDSITIEPLQAPPCGIVTIPGSKSITNRALILAALADGESILEGALFSEDTAVMADSLRRVGIDVVEDVEAHRFTVGGRGGRLPASGAELYIGNSGTSVRFLTALCALGTGRFRLDGVPRMRERPMRDLLEPLVALGVDAVSEAGTGNPPIVVDGAGGIAGGMASVQCDASSQFLSALLMVAPYARDEVQLEAVGHLRPHYIEITLRMMAEWGVRVIRADVGDYLAPAQACYQARKPYRIEPDASSASYFFAAAAVTGGEVTVPGLTVDALQGDVRFATEILVAMGCEVRSSAAGIVVRGPTGGALCGGDFDMSAISDTSLTLAAIAPFATSPTIIRNIGHSRLQECDRIAAARAALTAMGVRVEEREDGMTIYPAAHIEPARIETFSDHRVAMSFALVGLRAPGITIVDPACTAKTFPDYWRCLMSLSDKVHTVEG